ncbi:MAG: hypothetical protein Q8Q86_03650, partial [Candidatus Daviesbacteria bacterium]|nr:hypothetical protein [Candidatus Daviesbacteria bacterium]
MRSFFQNINTRLVLIVILSFLLGWQLGHREVQIKWATYKPTVSVKNKIPPEKDVDVLNYISFGRFEAGRDGTLIPPNVGAIQDVLKRHTPDLLD